MLIHRELRKKLLFLTLVPIGLAVVLLCLTFYFLHSDFLQRQSEQRSQFIVNLVRGDFDTQLDFGQYYQHLSSMLLKFDNVRSVALIGEDNLISDIVGLPIQSLTSTQLQKYRDADQNTHCHDKKCFTLTPVSSPSEANTIPQRILVVSDNYDFTLITHRAIIIGLTVIYVIWFIVYLYIRRFQAAITRPLYIINEGIERYTKGEYATPIQRESDSAYGELIDGINKLAQIQKSAQDNLQQNIEQSTIDLRETLETVEIQNIELDIARKSALQASRVKSEFLANTSHEIRTPLNGILGFSELLKKTELSPQQAEYLETIDESAKGLLTIINDILDFSRLEIGKLTLEYKPVKLRQVIEESLRLQAHPAHEKKLRLLTIIDHDIPENLLGDPLRLKQVLSNLLSNAIKFTNSGNILISVSKDVRADNRMTLHFRVTDSGIGLNQEQQDSLFDAFTQLDSSASRAYGGTGLGLAIAKGLVDRMNGQIGVESEPGKGATFWFTATLGCNTNNQDSQGYLLGSLRNKRVLIYDCETMSRAEIVHYIRGWGASVNEISEFDEILNATAAACRNGQVDLAILDAQVTRNTFDKNRLYELVRTLNDDYSLPVVVLAPPSVHRLIEPTLSGTHSAILQRPIYCNRFNQVVCEELGIIIPEIEQSRTIAHRGGDEEAVKILAVDDNPANLRLVCELLKDLDVKVSTADNGGDAVRLCDTELFDLILMDIQMPGMDGLDATRQIRIREKNKRRTPVVALTAHAANEQKARLLLAGLDDYLTKPVSENELRHVIERWVSHTTLAIAKPGADPISSNTAANRYAEINNAVSRETSSPTIDLSQDGLVDLELCLSLAKHKTDLARDMLQMLLDSLTASTDEIRTSLSEGNLKELQEVIHKLHGGSCYCGVPLLKQHASELDAKLQRVLQQNDDYPELEHDVNRLLSILKKLKEWQHNTDIEQFFSIAR